MLNGLDLFSGIGGIAAALAPWVRTIAYCENDTYAQSVLLSNMRRGALHCAPIWDDVRTLQREHIFTLGRGSAVDIISAGFPCQDISVAGNGAGLAGERSGLVSEVFRLTDQLRPTFVFLENVPAIRLRGLDVVIRTMASLGYDCRWDVLSAYDVGAPHKRERWFLLAHRNGYRLEGVSQCDGEESPSVRPFGGDAISDPSGELIRQQSRRFCWESGAGTTLSELNGAKRGVAGPDGYSVTKSVSVTPEWWRAEPDVGRVANGVPKRVDRLRALGNAVVPAQAREAFVRLMGLRSTKS